MPRRLADHQRTRRCTICKQPTVSSRHSYCEMHTIEARIRRAEWINRASRGTPTERGYGTAHKKERARVARVVEAGEAACSRCGGLIEPGTEWHLDHADDRQSYRGPSHALCNLRGRNGGGRTRWVSTQPPEPPRNCSRVW
jgi:hypothetical protein